MKTMIHRLGLGVLLTGVSAAAALAASSLGAGQSLAPGASLDVGNSRLVMQGDCNLVLYRGGQAAWHSQTDGKGAGCRAVMQTDGNLVVYNAANQPLWNSGTDGAANAILTLQTDGNLVITSNRQPIWSNGTLQRAQNNNGSGAQGGQFGSQGGGRGNNGQGGFGQGGQFGAQGGYNNGQGGFRGYGNQPTRRAQDDLVPGEWLSGRRNERITSRNRQFELRMQDDCNLVLYARNQPLWESRTRGAGRDCRAIFDRNGQLMVEADGRVVWTNRARARSAQPNLRLQDDGNLVAYDGQRAFWATNTENSRFGRGGFGGGYQYDQRDYDNNGPRR